ncbi:acyl-CoA dehydrogenase family protein [Streptomyces sp. NPDC047043]|uniref:acyl-CoA dehydrogenase family protein n=1 Tax=Streptomyces sp. NPDC047043 TaxID=3154497 RepID=UPI0033C2AA1D
MSVVHDTATGRITPPEPDLTPEDLVSRARDLVPELIARQAETEELTTYSVEIHKAFEKAGLYRTLIPRRYGGYEFDLRTFNEIVKILASGCPSVGWNFCLGAHHGTQVAAFWPESAQTAVFGDGDFVSSAAIMPSGTMRKVDGGWEVTARYGFCSGSPYATHHIANATPVDDAGNPLGSPRPFIAPRSSWTMLDDWGGTLGLKGTGSNTIVFDRGFVPDDHVLDAGTLRFVDVTNGTPGYRLHGNPLYAGPVQAQSALDMGALLVGMALGAFDEYTATNRAKTTYFPPIMPRMESPEYQRWTGIARGRLRAAEAVVAQGADLYMRACEDSASGRRPFDRATELDIVALGLEAWHMAWDVTQQVLFPTAGSTAAADGKRMQRIWRDMSTAQTHALNTSLENLMTELGRRTYGIATP